MSVGPRDRSKSEMIDLLHVHDQIGFIGGEEEEEAAKKEQGGAILKKTEVTVCLSVCMSVIVWVGGGRKQEDIRSRCT